MSVCEVKHNYETNLNIIATKDWPQMSALEDDDDLQTESERRQQQYALHCAVFNNDLKLISQLLRNYDIQLKDIHGLSPIPPLLSHSVHSSHSFPMFFCLFVHFIRDFTDFWPQFWLNFRFQTTNVWFFSEKFIDFYLFLILNYFYDIFDTNYWYFIDFRNNYCHYLWD